MTTDCARFERWLDEGRFAADAAWADAHASGCARCAAALELEDALSLPAASPVGAAFTERVLFRVRDAERGIAAARLPVDDVFDAWWVSAPAEPAAALALVTAALLVWQADGLWAWGLSLAVRWQAFEPASLPLVPGILAAAHLPGGAQGQALWLAMIATLGPAAWLGSWTLYRWVARAVSPPASAA